MKTSALVTALATVLPATVNAVYLNPDGLGQALIYPYYTANSTAGGSFNTYLSVVNHAPDTKAVRVRFREGRNGAEVASFNVFLSPHDAWTGAVVPTGSGAELLTRDASCQDGRFVTGPAPSLQFRNTLYTGALADNAGEGLDRTREGFVELLEMAVVTGADAAAVAQTAAGFPANCDRVLGATTLATAAPSGGLSGTLTLINVETGHDFTVNAEALADLANAAYYRAPGDPYPALDAAEVTPISIVPYEGRVYRSIWTRGIDAVSAVFMRSVWHGEYVLDAGTRSRTDFVVTFPTRHYYVRADGADAPFGQPRVWRQGCWENSEFAPRQGEFMTILYANREEAVGVASGSGSISVPRPSACSSVGVFAPRNASPHVGTGPISALSGSINTILFSVASVFQNGWVAGEWRNERAMNSLATSARLHGDGTLHLGAHGFNGLPTTGFSLRTFENGTLTCGSGACQGNYGGAFPLKYTRRIVSSD
jgi:hypothetical protein